MNYASGIANNLNGVNGYYHHNIVFFAWLLMFIAVYAKIIHLIELNVGKLPLIRYVKWVGRNVTLFYIVQWIIVGNIATEIYRTQGAYPLIYWFAGITAITSLIIFIWERSKSALKKTNN
jgi:hypothetical protein